MKKITIIFIFCSIVLGACSLNNDEIKKETSQSIQSFYDDLLLEDLDGVMSHISRDSEQYYQLYDEYRTTFEKFKYNYELKEISFDGISKDRITVSVSLSISGVDENDKFDEFNLVQVFTLKMTNNGEYKIYSIDTKYDF